MAEILLKNALTHRLVRGCYGKTESGNIVPNNTSSGGGSIGDPICSYNVNQTADSSTTVDTQPFWAHGFHGRQGSQDNRHADYFVTDCTLRGKTAGDGSAGLDPDCKLQENNYNKTLDGYSGDVDCSSNFDKVGMEAIMGKDKVWSKTYVAGKVLGFASVQGDTDSDLEGNLHHTGDFGQLKVNRLPLWKTQMNSADKSSYDCSNRKSHGEETYPERCGASITAHGGSGWGAAKTSVGELRDRCNAEVFGLQYDCGATGLMVTTGFRDPRLKEGVAEDPANLSTTAKDSIGWSDVTENKEACCLGAGTFMQMRRPMGEKCQSHEDCVGSTLDDDMSIQSTNIRCFSNDYPENYVEDGKTGTCRRDVKEGSTSKCDRVVFRSKYNPSNYGYFLGTDMGKCTSRIPRTQTDAEYKTSSNPKRLEVADNESPHPKTCDPNWSPYYSSSHMDQQAWGKACAPHFADFCKQIGKEKHRMSLPHIKITYESKFYVLLYYLSDFGMENRLLNLWSQAWIKKTRGEWESYYYTDPMIDIAGNPYAMKNKGKTIFDLVSKDSISLIANKISMTLEKSRMVTEGSIFDTVVPDNMKEKVYMLELQQSLSALWPSAITQVDQLQNLETEVQNFETVYYVEKPRWKMDASDNAAVARTCRNWVVGSQTAGDSLETQPMPKIDQKLVKAINVNLSRRGKGKKKATNLQSGVSAYMYESNSLLHNMCKMVDEPDSYVSKVLEFCNERVKHTPGNATFRGDIEGKCLPFNAKGDRPAHCPRWKTEEYGNSEGLCDKMMTTYPVEYDKLIWDYCSTPYNFDDRDNSGHMYDPACDCLSGEFIDPNSEFTSDDSVLRCGDPDDWDNRVITDDTRYNRRILTCTTLEAGDTIKQVGLMNRNMWMESCNPIMRDTMLQHVLLPQHKWDDTDGTKSCDIDPLAVKADGNSAYSGSSSCHMDRYQCQKQDAPPNICMNMIDMRSMNCVAVDGGTCAKFDNVNMLNNCGGTDYGDVSNSQVDCISKSCPVEGPDGTMIDKPCYYRFRVEDMLDGDGDKLKCGETHACPSIDPKCGKDCRIQCVGGGGQNCVSGECFETDGVCQMWTESCISSSDNADFENLARYKNDKDCGCPKGDGYDPETGSCIVGKITTDEVALKCRQDALIKQRENDKACMCESGYGFNAETQQCEENFKTSFATAENCRNDDAMNQKKRNVKCCGSVEHGWNDDSMSLASFEDQYAEKTCLPNVDTNESTAIKCEVEQDRISEALSNTKKQRNVECCDLPNFGWRLSASSYLSPESQFKDRLCKEDVQTDVESAHQCKQIKEDLAAYKKRISLNNERVCGNGNLGWNAKDDLYGEYPLRECLPSVTTTDATALYAQSMWGANEVMVSISPCFLIIVAIVLQIVCSQKKIGWLKPILFVLVFVGLFGTIGLCGYKTYTKINYAREGLGLIKKVKEEVKDNL
jgi:hypothetical protein